MMPDHSAVLSRRAPPAATVHPLDTPTNRWLAAGIGLLLPVLTVRTEYVGTPMDIVSRVVPVDFVCIAFLAILFLNHRMVSLPGVSRIYFVAILLALIPALTVATGEERNVWIQSSALVMAFAFYVAGLNIGVSRNLLLWLVAGTCCSVLAESVIVFHDALSSQAWFPDPMEGRVRGTFRASGQLGAFGFCAAGLILTFGTTLAPRRWRTFCTWTAILSASFVFLASRRTGMISVVAWCALFAVSGARFARERFYRLFIASFVSGLLLLVLFWAQVEASFAGQRLREALVSLDRPEGFIQNQFRRCLETADQWFPFGVGVGRGVLIDRAAGFEIHNTLLAVLVELGILGFLGYLAMVLLPLVRSRRLLQRPESERLGILLMTFLAISFVFMMHNTLYRDRTFLLYLGIATSLLSAPPASNSTQRRDLEPVRIPMRTRMALS